MTRAEFCAFARAHDNFVILTHRRPDGDTIGSAGALCLGLRQLGKTAFVLTNEQFTPRFNPFLDGLVCEALPAGATVISADIASEGLLSFDAVRMGLTPVCAVDHHGSNSLACPKLVEADKAACGEIVYAVLTELGVTVTKQIAECLYTAISTDTGCFKFSNTSANTHRTAAALIDAGADVYPINKVFFDTKSFARLRLEAAMLLLRQSDTTLTDAAYACGFSDPKYLNRSFQKNLGMSPRQWLLENRPDPSRAPSAEDPRTAQRILTPGECRALLDVLGVA